MRIRNWAVPAFIRVGKILCRLTGQARDRRSGNRIAQRLKSTVQPLLQGGARVYTCFGEFLDFSASAISALSTGFEHVNFQIPAR